MLRNKPSTLRWLPAAAVALAFVGAACSGGEDECLLDPSLCANTCDPTIKPDECTAKDDTTACSPDTNACEKMCMADNDCTVAGQKCDTVVMVCRDASKLTPDCNRDGCTDGKTCNIESGACEAKDCTVPGNLCATDKVCDAAGTKACVDPCTKDGFVCGEGKACNKGSKICEADCTVTGATCAEGKVCDSAEKVCVSKCGAESCLNGQVCGESGLCQNRCDAETDPAICPPDTVCDVGAENSGLCVTDCRVTASFCTVDQFCRPDGRCEGKCTTNANCASGEAFCRLDDPDPTKNGRCETRLTSIAECAAPTDIYNRTYLVVEQNLCKSVDALATCSAAGTRDTGVAVPGPTAFDGKFLSKARSTADTCKDTGGAFGWIYRFNVAYYDYQNDFPTSSLYDNVVLVRSATDSNTYAAVTAATGSTATTGVLTFELCRPSNADAESFAVFLKDGAGNGGNTLCMDAPAYTP